MTDDDAPCLAITAGSEREPIVGLRAPSSSNMTVDWVLAAIIVVEIAAGLHFQ